ncbi:hypothetical protein Tco_0355908, partial [Tanacetum coccineum]
RERMELDLEARLMGETLVLNRSLDPLNGDYIELNDLNEPLKLRRNQGDDLMLTIKEGEVIEEFRTRDDELDTGIDDYPNFSVLEDMDSYRDEGISMFTFCEPFLREVRIECKKGGFEGNDIIIHNGIENKLTKWTSLKEKKSTMLVENLRSGNLKCWSLETSRRLFNTILLINSTWRTYRDKMKTKENKRIKVDNYEFYKM